MWIIIKFKSQAYDTKKAIQILDEFGYHISIITNSDGIKAHKKGDKSYSLLEEAIQVVLQEIKK